MFEKFTANHRHAKLDFPEMLEIEKLTATQAKYSIDA